MPTEKSRYRNRGPSAPFDWAELKTHIKGFDHEHLVELLWMSAQYHDPLWKALMASTAMRLAAGDWEKTKDAIDYALYFNDHILYTDCHYGIILDEMIKALEMLKDKISSEFALRVAHYIFESGDAVSMNFEDDWDWVCSLEELGKWIKNNHST